ncbi:retroviral-like aspartic protease family protein [Oscillatoria sp. FACHB-1407]|uniref:retropepsin-like aspartic protease family protein n=1 Tax=Oscillatoria sp. FACHB-1407 TaxID=2692847 RepID=UPI001687FA73|nr:retropepsin-like aspartic protease [Oscillatoria sp. FACHB-1407]MBD2462619.1 retroviral-like aspartic protease family protein [Oscillatoria sp. FACHB-1407]
MPISFQSGATLTVLLSVVAIATASCGNNSPINSSAVQTSAPVASPVASPNAVSSPTTNPVASPAPQTQSDSYQRAIARASSAYTISQSAQSQDDWRLVASRWQQAIDLMASVPVGSPNHAVAQRKLPEYRRNLTYAQQQASRPTNSTNPGRVVVSPTGTPVQGGMPISAAPAVPSGAIGDGVFRVPITRRMGGTPVVNVTFNGSQTYEMIVDTGASGTLITQAMASALGVTPVGQVRVDTASARDVAFPLGYVNSIEVGGAVATDVVVAVAGPDLSVGLLGHDFFGNYDVTIRQNEVEFRIR